MLHENIQTETQLEFRIALSSAQTLSASLLELAKKPDTNMTADQIALHLKQVETLIVHLNRALRNWRD